MYRKPQIGFIGLGDQGAPIATQIVRSGFPLSVWARRAASAVPLAEIGAAIAPSKEALAARADIVCVCVGNDAEVRDVMLGDDGIIAHLRAGAMIVVHSTVLPETVIALEAIALERGLRLLDAPVSGGPQGARSKRMTVMVGGDASTLETARPVFETYASNIFHLGNVGAGQTMKLLNNTLAYANAALGAVALLLADRLGMSRATTADVIAASSGYSRAFDLVCTDAGRTRISAASATVRKDVDHFVSLLRSKADLRDNVLTKVADSALAQVAILTETAEWP